MSRITTFYPSFRTSTPDELRRVQGGALPLLGKIAVIGAAKAIVWGIDRATGRDNNAHAPTHDNQSHRR